MQRNRLNLCLGLTSLLVTVVVIDRVLSRVYPPFQIDGSMLIADPELGWRLRPGNHIERTGVTTNSTGWRGKEFSRGGDTPTVAFVGDSVTFGATTDSTTFPALFELRTGFRSLNFGVPNYGPLQYLRVVEMAEKLEPDHIIVGLFVGNDVSDCRHDRVVPLPQQDGRKVRWAWSGLYRFLLFRGVVQAPGSRSSAWDERTATRSEKAFLEMEWERLRVYRPGELRDEWACIQDSIQSLVPYHDRLTIMILPDELQVNLNLWETLMARASARESFDRDLPNRRLARMAAVSGLRVLDVTADLRRETRPTFFRWDSHPNPHGNGIIADAVEAHLRAAASGVRP